MAWTSSPKSVRRACTWPSQAQALHAFARPPRRLKLRWYRNPGVVQSLHIFEGRIADARGGAVETPDLADAAVTEAKLASGSVSLAKFAAGLYPVKRAASAPASQNSTGTPGEYYDDSAAMKFYFCVSENSWVRWSMETSWGV